MCLLVNCSLAFQYLLCFVHGLGQRTKEKEQKHVTKKLVFLTSSLYLFHINQKWEPCYTAYGKSGNYKFP